MQRSNRVEGASVRELLLVLCMTCASALVAAQEPGEVEAAHVLGSDQGGFGGTLASGDAFGGAVALLGDLDGDGVREVAIGAPGTNDGGPNRGAVWILFLEADGTVRHQVQIAEGEGGFDGDLSNLDAFGSALATLGDLDGDGLPELAVGAPHDDDGGFDDGAVWILFLGADGFVRTSTKLDSDSFDGELFPGQEEVGRALAGLGDLDGDGVPDLACAALDEEAPPGFREGVAWILLLQPDGTVKGATKIGAGAGGFDGALDHGDDFGRSLAALGDLDGDGLPELAVGATGDDDGGSDRGAVWVLSLTGDGSVAGHHKLSAAGTLPFPLDDGDRFGRSVAATGDLDGDGRPDLAAGAPGDDDGGLEAGAVWELFLDAGGAALSARKLGEGSGGFPGELGVAHLFGAALAAGPLDAQGDAVLFVGAPGDSTFQGDVWVLSLVGPPEEPVSEVFVPDPDAFAGRAGRPALVPVESGSDFVDTPVIAVPDTSGGKVTVRSGQAKASGDVAFAQEGLFDTGSEPSMAETGLFTGAGDFVPLADLVVANEGGDSFSLLAGNPDGTFGPHVEFSLLPSNSRPTVIRAGDLDGDLRDDVVLGGADGVSVFLGDGAGGFAAPAFVPLPGVTDLSLGLVDGDLLLDVVATTGKVVTPGDPLEAGAATVLLGQGGGVLAPAGSFATGAAVASVLLGDLAGDEGLDALLAIHDVDAGPGGIPEGRLELWLGDGTGLFAPAPGTPAFAAADADGIHPRFGALGDLDGDGDLDALYTSKANIALPEELVEDEQPALVVTVLTNLGGGAFGSAVLGTPYVGQAVDPLLADIVPDDGGALDGILVWWQDTGAGLPAGGGLTSLVSVLAGDGTGGFFDPAESLYPVGDEPGDGVLVDTDGAGRLDIVVPNAGDRSLTLLQADGAGGVATFTVPGIDPLDPGTLPPGDWVGGPRRVQLASLDGNAPFLDVVAYNAWEDRSGLHATVFASVTVLLSGQPSGLAQVLPLPRGGELLLAPVDGDARADVIVTQRLGAGGPDEVLVFPGLPAGTFGTTPLVLGVPAGFTLSGGLAVHDLDGGGPDVLTTAIDELGEGHLLRWDAGGGEGSPLAPALVPLEAGWDEVSGLVAGDVTGDGRPDVLVGVRDGRLLLLAGTLTGGLELADPGPEAAAGGGGALALGDLDGDGVLDVVSCTAAQAGVLDQAAVRTLVGRGDGTFAVQTEAGLQATGLFGELLPLLGDLDNDGATDLVLVHGSADAVSVLTNTLNTFEDVGSGKAGKGGLVPRLAGKGYTTPGGAVQLVLDRVVGGAPGLLFVGTDAIPAGLLHVGTTLLQLPLVVSGTPGVAGAGSLTIPAELPDDPVLVGAALALQAFFLDPDASSAAPLGISASNGLAFVVVD